MRFKLHLFSFYRYWIVELVEIGLPNNEGVIFKRYYSRKCDADSRVAFTLASLSTQAFKIAGQAANEWTIFEPREDYKWFSIPE